MIMFVHVWCAWEFLNMYWFMIMFVHVRSWQDVPIQFSSLAAMVTAVEIKVILHADCCYDYSCQSR